MKKFFPAIFVAVVFTALMVVQMSFNGQRLEANKVSSQSKKYATFENIYKDLKITTTKGTVVKLSDVKQPIVVMNFWASWCRPCIAEFKTLNEFITKFDKKDILVLGVNNDDENPKKAVAKTEKKQGLKFESMIDTDSELTSKFFISAIPASIVFHKGKVIHYINEEFDFSTKEFVNKIKMQLKQK